MKWHHSDELSETPDFSQRGNFFWEPSVAATRPTVARRGGLAGLEPSLHVSVFQLTDSRGTQAALSTIASAASQ